MSAADDRRRGPGSDGSAAPENKEADVRQASGDNTAARSRIDPPSTPSGKDAKGAPRWRQIEIMRERQALRKMLDDLDLDDLEIEAEVFGSKEERETYYRPSGDDQDEDDEVALDLSDDDTLEEDEP